VTKESTLIVKDVVNGIDDIESIAVNVWNAVKDFFEKAKDWLENQLGG
jgi:hypothetical protein